MSQFKLNIKKKLCFIFSALILVPLLTTSCFATNEEELIEGILQEVDALNGEITLVTKDGETITIKITKGEPIDDESTDLSDLEPGSTIIVRKEDIKKESTTNVDLASILPSLNSVEDVFRLLEYYYSSRLDTVCRRIFQAHNIPNLSIHSI